MNIQARVRLSTLTVLAAISIVAITIWVAYAEIRDATRQGQQANRIARGVSDFKLQTFDYLMNRQEGARVQWRAVSDHVDHAIAANQLSGSEQEKILLDLREKKALIQNIFEQLTLPVIPNGLGALSELKQRQQTQLFDQLVITQRSSVGDAFRLTELAAERITLAQQRMMILALAGLFLIALIKVATSWFINRNVPASVGRMQQALQEVAADKRNFRLGMNSNDEIGDMPVDFGAMVSQVQESDAGLPGAVAGREREIGMYEIEGRDFARFKTELAQFADVAAVEFPKVLRGQHDMQQVQAALYDSEERLRLALDSAHMGIFDWNVTSDHITWSRRHEELWGLKPGEFGNSYASFAQRVHPDDLPGISKEITRCMAAHALFESEFRVVWPDGSTHWISSRGEFAYSADGQPLRMCGTVVEITARKQAEQTLRENESRYRLLVQHSPYCIHEINLDGCLISMNRMGLEMMHAHDDAEIFGMHYLDTVADSDKDRIGQLLELALQGQPAEFEFVAVNNLKFQSSFVPIMDENGVVQRLMGMTLDITERKKAQEEVERLAYTDALTHLPNRTALQLRLGQAVQQAQSHSRTMALLLLDLNNFREINDTLGHQNGDRVLVQVADRLRSVLWDSDVLARLGGDEFAVLLPRLADKEHIQHVLGKVAGALHPAIMIDGAPLDVQAAIGVALYPDHGHDADTLLRHADVALYGAKERNLAHLLYDSKSDHYNPHQLALMAELRLALQREELVLHYQPVVDIKSGKTMGVEALVRWQHPSRGLLYPDTFIAAAEKTGLIAPLTTWVLTNALRQQHRWHRAGIAMNVSVNLSVRNLQQPDIVVEISDMLLSSGVDPENLTLEITESAIMVDPERAKAVLTELHELGIRFAIDDFGIGQSSLGYLRHLPVDKLKVDKSFVMDSTNVANAAIVRATIGLAHSLGLTVTAEGVEDEQSLSALKLLGCEHAQGYYMSKPQAVDKLSAWLRESPWGLPLESA